MAPGVRPAKAGVSGIPPITTGRGAVTGFKPSDNRVEPKPVPYITMNAPRDTGFDALLIVLSWFVIAASIGESVKISGATEPIETCSVALPAPDVTANVAMPGAISEGICALIWNGSAPRMLAGSPFIVTDEPANPAPKIDTMPPGAISGVRLAAFTTPPANRTVVSGDMVQAPAEPAIS